MTQFDLMQLPVGAVIFYKGRPGKVEWKEEVSFLIFKSTKKDEPDIYWRNFSIFCSLDGSLDGVTFSSSFPAPKLLEISDFTLI